MKQSLEQIQEQWLKDYFETIGRIWDEWKLKKISMRERDETLQWYRKKLWELRQGKNRSLVLQTRPKPKNEEEWLSEVEI